MRFRFRSFERNERTQAVPEAGKEGPYRVHFRRAGALLLTATLTVAAVVMFGSIVQSDGYDWLDVPRVALIAIAGFWLAWGTCTAVLGVLFDPDPRRRTEDISACRTAILMPVYNESAEPVMARLETMIRQLTDSDSASGFEVFLLSDSTRPEAVVAEQAAFARLQQRVGDLLPLYYRHREKNSGRKAGNIADFVRRSGGGYDFMLVLDADSLMRGETIIEMVRRMAAEPQMGLLQSLPQTIGMKTLFGRLLQFSSFLYGPSFARGVAALQGTAGPFWGHNALIRVEAFARSCGMQPLKGRPPFGGHVLSHDTVEAALLARDGWLVRLDPDLTGSYEEAPPNLIEYAKRDRRWCQGNLQHARVLTAPRLKLWSRAMIVQGIFSYLGSPVWLLFLLSTLAAPLFAMAPVYFDERVPFPIFPHPETSKALALLFGVVVLLIVPKASLLVRVILQGQAKRFGSILRVTLSAIIELFLTSLFAPVHMMFQTRSVLQVMMGADGGWPASAREDGGLSFLASFKASWWMAFGGIAALAYCYEASPDLLPWLMPVAIPLAVAPLLVWMSGSLFIGQKMTQAGVFLTPIEVDGDPAVQLYRRLSGEVWTGEGTTAAAEPSPLNPALA
ncbi:glucans biosynthesis glucosyltransferase MdoH [Roseibium sp. CAU 1637]|uniref:Glucans biosynthesis glucosyltransferase H n=1 Tax=Roseibium limicola TaxID=2816037 RepID=A0A939EPG9_9HYPH|nr:glucans biosynthesis glucosyltransferase MdoH [Roseibium limicola]MBO0344719.1 glucans biosynthesis glucosyltransferase MdoH [Roseibium limicola]